MRRNIIYRTVYITLVAILLLSCKGTKEVSVKDTATLATDDGAGTLYSDKTLILSLVPEYTDADLDALAEKYDMEIIYRYHSFSMCAVSLSRPHTGTELRALMATLEQEPIVVSAELDHIMQLYGGEAQAY